MEMTDSKVRRMVYLGLMVAIAMALHIFESLIPLPTPVPGAKLGLANIVTLYVIIRFGCKEAITVTVIRTTLGAMFGSGLFTPTFFLSFFGGLVSALLMSLVYGLWPTKFSIIGVSLLGALAHNVTQLAVASMMYEQLGFFYLLPYLLFFALPTGFFVGIVTQQMVKHSKI